MVLLGHPSRSLPGLAAPATPFAGALPNAASVQGHAWLPKSHESPLGNGREADLGISLLHVIVPHLQFLALSISQTLLHEPTLCWSLVHEGIKLGAGHSLCSHAVSDSPTF